MRGVAWFDIPHHRRELRAGEHIGNVTIDACDRVIDDARRYS
jgi:hypothetical protein